MISENVSLLIVQPFKGVPKLEMHKTLFDILFRRTDKNEADDVNYNQFINFLNWRDYPGELFNSVQYSLFRVATRNVFLSLSPRGKSFYKSRTLSDKLINLINLYKSQ